MNPYAKILSLLEALPEDRHMLVSGQRRMVVADAPCGCLFGSLVPESLWGSASSNTVPFRESAFPGLPLTAWVVEQVGLPAANISDAAKLYAFVAELERENDRFMSGGNTPIRMSCSLRLHVQLPAQEGVRVTAHEPPIKDPVTLVVGSNSIFFTSKSRMALLLLRYLTQAHSMVAGQHMPTFRTGGDVKVWAMRLDRLDGHHVECIVPYLNHAFKAAPLITTHTQDEPCDASGSKSTS